MPLLMGIKKVTHDVSHFDRSIIRLFNLYTLSIEGLTFALDEELTVNYALNSLCINSGVIDGGGTTIGLY